MAYGGLQGQAPQGVAPINGLPTNDVRELTVRSGNNISAGDVVDVEDGEVFNKFISVSIEQLNQSTLDGKVCGLDDNLCLIARPTSTTNGNTFGMEIRSYSYDVKANNIKQLKVANVTLGKWGNSIHYEIIGFMKANATQTLLSYRARKDSHWYTYLLSITIDSSGNINHKVLNTVTDRRKALGLIRLSDKEILNITCGYETGSYKTYGEFLTIDSNSINYSAPVEIYNSNELESKWCSTPIDNYLIGTKIGAYNAPNTMTLYKVSNKKIVPLGNAFTFDAELKGFVGTVRLNEVNYIVTLSVSLTYAASGCFINLFSFDTKTLSSSLEQVTITNTSDPMIALIGNNVVFSQASALKGWEIIPNGFSRLQEQSFLFSINNIGKLNNDIGFINGNDSAFFIINNQQFSGANIINTSKTAIALQSGTSGQPISVGFGGYCECPNVTEGQTITSSGVMGYGVQDGWLDVRPAYNSMITSSIVTGNFTATNQSIKNIELGFKPKLVICYTKNNNTSDIAGGSDGLLSGQSAPRILTSVYEDNNYGKIEKTGFSFKCYASSMQVYYIAFR